MQLQKEFRAAPAPGRVPPAGPPSNRLGPLGVLRGTWKGQGFNQIWRPFDGGPPGQDRFLELNRTVETLKFEEIPGRVPNRGLLPPDISLHGLTYLQQVRDANVVGPNGRLAGLYLEPGIWGVVPPTTGPQEPATVARLANTPHGTALVAWGTAGAPVDGPPSIAPVGITPFAINPPHTPVPFPESNLSQPSAFRTAPGDIPNVTQAMVDNPNALLATGLQGKTVISTVTLKVATRPLAPPDADGGASNIAFLQGGPGGPVARAAQLDAVFWIETLQEPNGQIKYQLQYSQVVLLNFNGLSWPHVSVATLIKQ